MAVLSEADRVRVHKGLMRYLSPRVEGYPCTGFTKSDLRDAIDDTDDWIDTNQSDFVSALPEPFATQSGAALKTLLFCAVSAMRVSSDFAKEMFGEID
jgi:hypothetical protein